MTKKEFTKYKHKNINQYRTACRKVMKFVSTTLGHSRHGLKLNKALEILIEHLGIENPSTNIREWMLNSYLNRNLEIFEIQYDKFYSSSDWRKLRRIVLDKYGYVCMKCNSLENIAVDHILPRSKFKELELVEDNMQVLCLSCNSSKGNREYSDYRKTYYA